MSPTEALEGYFGDHYESLYRFLRSSGAGEPVAEDVCQEAFLKLHRHLAESRPTHQVRAWLFRVAYRAWIDRLREGQRETPAQESAWDLWGRVLRDPAPGAEQELLARERHEWLREAIERLSQVERQALHLRADGLRYREIAEVLGVGYWAVVDAVRRALDILGEEAHGR
jgi:RNA polymerase sigma-70 factor (ECF subfamily)